MHLDHREVSVNATASAASVVGVPIVVEETAGVDRMGEPVRVGIPIARGTVFEHRDLALVDEGEAAHPVQVQVLARWQDGSIKWALLDFVASVEAKATARYELRTGIRAAVMAPSPHVMLRELPGTIEVDTGPSRFVLNTHVCKPFERIIGQGGEILDGIGSRIVLMDDAGVEYQPRIQDIAVEAAGPLRVTLRMSGAFEVPKRAAFADFIARLSFFAGRSLIELRFTLRNPRAARHEGGFWDLGDPGSVYLRDLSIQTPLAGEEPARVEWRTEPGEMPQQGRWSALEIYQDSSGGEHWRSENHVNRFGRVTTTFPGYRVVADGKVLRKGKRASPIVSIRRAGRSVSGAVFGFWQNFPKAIETNEHVLSIRLFPPQYSDVHELQPGEQKTHTVFWEFGDDGSGGLDWIQVPLVPRTKLAWYVASKAISYLVPRGDQDHGDEATIRADRLVDIAVSGDQTFCDRREIIDEYGWRHFGDLYGDHESVGRDGGVPRVSHYNNQYDVLYGATVQYTRTGDQRWFELMRDLANHVIDIDLYHTRADRPAFNSGMFWHTEHYSEAKTASHRAYSKANIGGRSPLLCGGGPSSEHNYTTGLLHYYFLTGNPAAGEAVCQLADWVITIDDGRKARFGLFDRRPTGLASITASRDYHGPGRGAGNSINAVLDAYVLTRERRYLAKAEELIRRCIHPCDDVQARGLMDIERRWSYTVFLQVLGKYLDLKVAEQETDRMYGYAVESLLHYARWVVEREVPYSQVLDKVEIPTETWPAQDIRKCNVLLFAAKYSTEPWRSMFLGKARFFFEACLRDLAAYETCTLTRPVVILMTNAFMHAYFQAHPEEGAPLPASVPDYGRPKTFKPQLHELQRLRQQVFSLTTSFLRNLPWR